MNLLEKIDLILIGEGKDKEEDDDKGNWIKKATENKGGLHRSLGIPEDEKIPAKDLKVKKGDSSKVKKEKVLAKTLKGLHK